MRVRKSILAVGFALACAGSAGAHPEEGFSIYTGRAVHDTVDQGAAGFNYESAGTSLGIDYQWPCGASQSLNLLIMSTWETYQPAQAAGGEIVQGGHALIGLQWRYWIDAFFAGIHAGMYAEHLTLRDAPADLESSRSVNGGGLAAGWALDGTWAGVYFGAQVDRARIDYTGITVVSTTSARLHIGYRW